MWRRSDARLWHVDLFLPFEASLQTPDRFSVILLGFREDYRPTSFLFPMHCYFISGVCIINLFICIMFAFVISYVQTVLRVLSKYSPSLLIWSGVDEGDLMDEEFDSESDAYRSPSQSRAILELVTCIIYASATPNKSHRASLRRSMSC